MVQNVRGRRVTRQVDPENILPSGDIGDAEVESVAASEDDKPRQSNGTPSSKRSLSRRRTKSTPQSSPAIPEYIAEEGEQDVEDLEEPMSRSGRLKATPSADDDAGASPPASRSRRSKALTNASSSSTGQKGTRRSRRKNKDDDDGDDASNSEIVVEPDPKKMEMSVAKKVDESTSEIVTEAEPKKRGGRPPRPLGGKKDLVAATAASITGPASRSTRSQKLKEQPPVESSPEPIRRSGRQRKPKKTDDESSASQREGEEDEEFSVTGRRKRSTRGKESDNQEGEEEAEQAPAKRATRSRKKAGGDDDDSVASHATTASTRSTRSASRRTKR
jgi:hypothetical protein